MEVLTINNIIKKLRKTLRRIKNSELKFLNPYILKYLSPRQIDYSKYLIIFGTGRSGTTWLAELINQVPNSVLIFEPLHSIQYQKFDESDLNLNEVIDPEEDLQDYYKFFEKIFSLKYFRKWETKFIQPKKLFKVDYYIFKFIRANLLINWLSNNFPLKKPVFIIRHPCAVVSSRMNLKWIPNKTKRDKFNKKFPQFTEISSNLTTELELTSLSWCMNNYVPLFYNRDNSFIVVSYEGLIINPEKELKRIFELWGMDYPNNILYSHTIPSKTFNMNQHQRYVDKNEINSNKLLQRWKNELTKSQINTVLEIVSKSGMDFYSEDLEPDYKRLYGINPLNL